MSLKVKVIISSTRPGRVCPLFAGWIAGLATERDGFDVELVDLAELALPLMDEPKHPVMKDYQHDHTKRWAAIVDEADAFIFVSPEYDSFPPAAVINAVQYLVHEWNRKPAGFVSYGGVSGGTRAMQELRMLLSNLGVMPLHKSVPVPFFPQFIKDGVLTPNEQMADGAALMLNELADWAGALKTIRG